METFLWICQSILALGFLYSGFCKAFLGKEKVLAMGQTGIRDISSSFMHLIGILELLGVAGIILPWCLNIVPLLTPITAVCFAIIMILAVRVHYRLKEPKNVLNNIFLLVLSLLVAYFRFAQLQGK
jgi:uncharacterized membrane protein YphA (DoxX/SURF4 family)